MILHLSLLKHHLLVRCPRQTSFFLPPFHLTVLWSWILLGNPKNFINNVYGMYVTVLWNFNTLIRYNSTPNNQCTIHRMKYSTVIKWKYGNNNMQMITLVLTKMENNKYKIKDSDLLGCEHHITTEHHIPEDRSPQYHSWQKLKSQQNTRAAVW